MKRLANVLMTIAVASSCCFAAEWEMAVKDDATVVLSHKHAPVVQMEYVFWGADWKYAGARMRLDDMQGDGYTFSGEVPGLGVSISGTIKRKQDNALKFLWRIDAARDMDDIIGGGVEFSLKPDSPAFATEPTPPVLLGGDKGWKWEVGSTGASVIFDPSAANVYFERGNKSRIRTFFFSESLTAGRTTIAATVTLPAGGDIAKSLAERYGPENIADWHENALLWNEAPVDLSFLNHKPAGKHGFVKADGERLVFEDGTPARFWGGNIAAYAIFADKDRIKRQARRIAKLGFNLMRFHHHDSTRWVKRTVIDKSRDDSQHFDPEVMDRLDWWIKCLKDEGVYVWLDLHVGRQFKKGDGIGEGLDEMGGRDGEGKGFCYFNDRIKKLMMEFNEAYLKHKNRYTGLACKDDPAVMGMLLTNENDLTHHFGNLMLPDKNNPVHNRIFEAAVDDFCQEMGLPRKSTWRTWEAGPSKIFLSEQEHRFNSSLLNALDSLGIRVPVATTNTWGGMGLCGLPALAEGGIIDVHSYGDAEALSSNPRYDANFISWIAAGQVVEKPLSISEWNVPYPATDRFTTPMYVMGIASLQGWDAPMIYNYSQRRFDKPARPFRWSTYSDPAITGVMPAAAIAFRQGHVSRAKETFCLKLNRRQIYYEGKSARNCATIRTLAERSRIVIALPDTRELDWDRKSFLPEDATVIVDPDRDYVPRGQTFIASDTGELRRDWAAGIQTINTAMTQAASGWTGGEKIELSDCTFSVETPKSVVAVTSLDSTPIRSSKHLLITAVARVVARNNRMPFLSELVKGELAIRSDVSGLELFASGSDGVETPVKAPDIENGAYVISLPVGEGTHWYYLKKD